MKPIITKISNVLFKAYLGFVLLWVTLALSFQLFFIYLQFSGQEKRAQHYSQEIEWRVDGRFKDNPKNIWYEGDK